MRGNLIERSKNALRRIANDLALDATLKIKEGKRKGRLFSINAESAK